MRKLLKSALLLTALSCALTAETIFNLGAQHFSNSLDGEGEAARYNLPKCYVTTGLKYSNGRYVKAYSLGVEGMDVEIKTPSSNWSVSFDMSYYIGDEDHTVRLTSDTGKTLIVVFRMHEIYFNGEKIYGSDRFERRELVSFNVTKSGDEVTFTTGFVTKTITFSNFSKLKFVHVSLNHELYDSYHPENYYDYLIGLNIGSSN